jgi:hypothetical protein
MKDLQNLIDQYVHSESGAELNRNLMIKHGAVADMVFDPETNMVAYQLLAPKEAMAFDRMYSFQLKDSLHQKDKEHNRLVLRSDAGVVYTLEPIKTDDARYTYAYYQLEPEQLKIMREVLKGFAHRI